MLRSFSDCYGKRPNHPWIFHLNAWEFAMWWIAIAKKTRTAAFVDEKLAFVLEFDENLDYTKELHKDYLLLRRTRPMVPAPMSMPMPSACFSKGLERQERKERQARLSSIYMRPWTMVPQYATPHVPYLGRLHIVPDGVGRKRKGKQSGDDRSYAAAWRWYLRGNILSDHQRRIISAFMALNSATSSTDRGEDFSDELPKGTPESYDTARAASSVHALVKRMSAGTAGRKGDVSKEDTAEGGRSQQTALQLGEELWGLQGSRWQLGDDPLRGVELEDPTANAATGEKVRKPETSGMPVALRLHPYVGYTAARRRVWFRALQRSERPPNAEQLHFLESMADRLHSEAAEAAEVLKGGAGSCPVNTAVLAPPGTGKTYCIL